MLRRWSLGLVLAGCLAFPAGALANAYTEVAGAYAASGTASIPACQFSSDTLQAALTQAPTYSYQYASDISDAIAAALASRANGDCATARAPAAASRGAIGPASRLRSADTRLPTSLTAAGSGRLPTVLLVAFVLVGLAGLGLLGGLGLRALGAEPRLIRSARHSLREAEYRIGAGWEDLADRLRR
jgi:hypothetical protein